MVEAFKGWTAGQRKVVTASFLGWTLDAFDYFLLVFVIEDVARDFGTTREAVAWALTLTLAMRPLGAFIFGRLADRFGRRPILMLDVALYSVMGLASALAPNLATFLVVRALFGVAMGGEWGIGASLTMETVNPKARGLVSGLLQSGYPTGYLVASVVYWLLYDAVGWRGMFVVGFVPALLVLYIRRHVPESAAWKAERAHAGSIAATLMRHWKLALFAIVLMTAFNFFSHGTQDLYPTFLQSSLHYNAHTTGTITIIYNIGAILGGWTFGMWSQRIGRRRAMMIAALLAIPVTYLWAFSSGAVLAGGRCLCDAVLRSGGLGRGAGVSDGTLPARRTCHLSGHHVSDRQFHRLIQCAAADVAGGRAGRQLPGGAGLGGAGGRRIDCAARRIRARSAQRGGLAWLT